MTHRLAPPPSRTLATVYQPQVMPSVPPPPVRVAAGSAGRRSEPAWFEALTGWAEREQRGVFGVAGRLLLACAAVLAALWFAARL